MQARPTLSHSRKAELQQQALTRALTGESVSNYPAIFAGFVAKGISEDQIKPRENVFTFQAWKALGRYVRKGEHGVRVLTYIDCVKETPENPGEKETFTVPRATTVFHVSQTEPKGGN
jgi:antirestriction protein ArdC